MPAHIASNASSPGRSYNQARTLSPVRVAITVVAIASVAFAVYIAETYPKRYVHSMPRVYQAALPYDLYALEPSISAETMDYHYNKHDYGYDKKLQSLVNNTKYADLSLLEIYMHANGTNSSIANNAGQLLNHNFFWSSMTPDESKRRVSSELSSQLEKDFKTADFFWGNFTNKAVALFGSGWIWVVYNTKTERIEIMTTPNGDYVPNEFIPLFNCDIWEHAYYIDYRNKRDEYVKNFRSIVNWEFASRNLLA